MPVSFELTSRKSNSPSTQVIELIRSQIAAKKVRPGEKLPPIREFGKAVGVGNYSVRRAFAKLTEEGVLDTIRGSGTYVTGKAVDISSSKQANKVRTFCVISAFSSEGTQVKLSHPITVSSMLEECKKLNTKGRLLSPNIDILSLEEIISEIKDRSYDGVIWLYPTSEHWSIVKAMHERGLPIAVTSHSHYPVKVPSVQGNEMGAAHQIGRYLAARGFNKVVVLSAEEQPGANVCDVRSGLHMGMKIGLLNAFEELHMAAPELVFNKYSEDNYIERLIESSKLLDAHTSLMVANTNKFQEYLKKDPDRVADMFRGHQLIVSTSQGEYHNLDELARRIDFSVQVYPYELIGRAVVHKLNNLIDGKFEDTTTLVNGVFETFDLNRSKEIDTEVA